MKNGEGSPRSPDMNDLPQLTLIQPPIEDAAYPAVPFGIEPLSLLVIASLTPRDRFRVKILDGMIRSDRSRLIDPNSALVGITVTTPVREAAYRIAAEYRKLGIPVIMALQRHTPVRAAGGGRTHGRPHAARIQPAGHQFPASEPRRYPRTFEDNRDVPGLLRHELPVAKLQTQDATPSSGSRHSVSCLLRHLLHLCATDRSWEIPAGW